MAKKTRTRETKGARPVARTKSKNAKRSSAPSAPKGAQDLPDYVVAQLFGPTSARPRLTVRDNNNKKELSSSREKLINKLWEKENVDPGDSSHEGNNYVRRTSTQVNRPRDLET